MHEGDMPKASKRPWRDDVMNAQVCGPKPGSHGGGKDSSIVPPDQPKVPAPSESERRELLGRAHGALGNLLPPGLAPLLPTLRPEVKIEHHDFDRIISHIQIPNFRFGSPSFDWARHFVRRIACRSHERLAHHLLRALEVGAGPQSRLSDVQHAWYELAFLGVPTKAGGPSLSARFDDAETAMTSEQIAKSESQPQVSEMILAFRSSVLPSQVKGWNQTSVLKQLGYRVGISGPPASRRRVSLEACLLLPDKILPEDQRSFWGRATTRRRLRAMLHMLRLFINLASDRRSGDWSVACTDWTKDVEWLEATFPKAR